MSPKQLVLWCAAKPPRQKRRRLAHSIDQGEFPDGSPCSDYRCRRCGWSSGHIRATPREIRRGIPCPQCNAPPRGAGRAPSTRCERCGRWTVGWCVRCQGEQQLVLSGGPDV